jgi:hypothetical protein
MPEFDAANFTSKDPAEFHNAIKNASKDQLKAAMTGEYREAILNDIFERTPGRFIPAKAGNTSAVIHWNVGDRPDGGVDTYELVIANGTCTLSPKPEREPTVSLSVGGPEFLQVVSGNGNPVALFMTGKLKAKGDLGLAANIPNLFNTPKG